MANLIDLTTVDAVAAWLAALPQNGGTVPDETVIQSAITGYSRYILTRTGRAFLSGVQTYNERYNGNGSARLMMRNYPVLSVASLTIGNRTVPQSPDYVQAGWAIDTEGSQCSIVLIGGGGESWPSRGGWGGGYPGFARGAERFHEGMQNIGITYTAGYITTTNGESQSVPASPGPYTVTANAGSQWYADLGATDAGGNSLAGMYTVAAGVYTFDASLAGASVLLNYQQGCTPDDLCQAVTEIVAEAYRRKNWIGQASQMQPGVGTTSYRSWEMSPQNAAVIERYTSRFLA